MFRRRTPLTFLQSLRQILWPRMGWWRFIKYYRLRIVRLSSSAESIAINLAGGSAMSFTPFFGIHIFGGMGMAWILGHRINLIASTVGTFVGNPWTFPFLLFASYSLGGWILSFFGSNEGEIDLNPDVVEQHGENLLSFLSDNFADIFIPTAVGGTLLAIVSFPIYYFLYFYLVRGAQRARKLRMRQKQKKLFNKKSHGE